MKNVFILLIALIIGVIDVHAQKKYQVGDIYNKDGVKGIVIKVTDDGEHGLIMSLVRSGERWLKDKNAKFSTGAFDEEDGTKNMEAVIKYIEENGKSWEDFPLFNWCRSLGKGWYIPAKNELNDILLAINGDIEMYHEKNVQAFSKKIVKAKGKKLIDDGIGGTKTIFRIYSSTETENGSVYMLYFIENIGSSAKNLVLGNIGTKKGKLVLLPISKTGFQGGSLGGNGSRAVYKF